VVAEPSDALISAWVTVRSDQFPVDRTVRIHDDPLVIVDAVSSGAIRLGLSVSVAKEGAAYRLYVSGFGSTVRSEERRLLSALSLPDSTVGSILVRVEKDETVRRDTLSSPSRNVSSPSNR